ncbi:phenylacetyl-CoA ligase [Aspergillus luchuensis]|uniref:Phenylacetyl-CoA ligase n=1 Tax=Aspergillus kawachii TaxID=1069201 RepID=A0A146F4S1_ASPKA|nr:phenylacetyl-CoA ligase [Aspergillus luchuensis]
MVFLPPKEAGTLPPIPDNIPLSEFMLTDLYGRNPLGYSRDPFICGITGKSFSALEVVDRVDYLSRALSKELNWKPNTGTEWDKTLAIFSLNTIDTLPLSWAVHQLGGLVSPANAAYSAAELKYQLLDSKAKALFTCLPLLQTALEAASLAGLPKDRIYLLEVPPQLTPGVKAPAQFKTVSQFIEEGKSLPKVERLNWAAGEGSRRTAFLCYSSGTSGLPVPPIIINMLRNHETCAKYNLSSIRSIFTGAAPLGVETAEDFQKLYPNVIIRQGYGLTETSTVVSSTHPNDVYLGSSGTLLAGVEMRIVTPEGKEITDYDTPGELVVRSPSVVLGYLNNEKANRETFEDGWMRTGDEAVVRVGPKKTEHIFIVDRIKELIKVKKVRGVTDRNEQGLQVAPAELEAHLLTHPAVADCAVIAIPDEAAGEIPKAIVVKSPSFRGSDEEAIQSIKKHVEEHKARHKWLKGGVRFIDAIPKSPSGKILRRMLRDQEKEARRKAGSKL